MGNIFGSTCDEENMHKQGIIYMENSLERVV